MFFMICHCICDWFSFSLSTITEDGKFEPNVEYVFDDMGTFHLLSSVEQESWSFDPAEIRIYFNSTVILKFLLFLWMITLFIPRVCWFIIYWYDYDWFTIDVSITAKFLKSEMDVEYVFNKYDRTFNKFFDVE